MLIEYGLIWSDGFHQSVFAGSIEEAIASQSKINFATVVGHYIFNEGEHGIAIRRWFNKEDPEFVRDADGRITRVYYPKKPDIKGSEDRDLPEPFDQWSRAKEGDVKVKIHGTVYQARIVPFLSNEIIKPNFVHLPAGESSSFAADRRERAEKCFLTVVEKLKTSNADLGFRRTAVAGESVNLHPFRVYLEISSKHYRV